MLSLQEKMAALKKLPASSVSYSKVAAPVVEESSASSMPVVLDVPEKKEPCEKSSTSSAKKSGAPTTKKRGVEKSPAKSDTIGMGRSVIDYLGRVGVIESDLSTQWAVEYPSGTVRFFFKHNKDLKVYHEE